MFSVTLIGKDALVAKLDAMPATVHAELVKETHSLAIGLQAHIVNQKLHGQVLKQRTGNLARSIQEQVTEGPQSIEGRVFSAGDVRYAAIHEFGFHGAETVKAHIRTMVFGREAAPFTVGPFTRQVNLPERSFMRSSLAEFQTKIAEGYANAIQRAAARPA